MRVFLTTLGCRLNEAEAESWARELDGQGHHVAKDADDADVVVLNTCAVTAEAARKSRKYAAALHRQSPSARMVMTGCYSELEPEKAAEISGVDLVVPNRKKEELVSLLNRTFDTPTMPKAAELPQSAPAFAETRTRAFVKVQDGCRNRCTFCIVTSLRGDERSRSIDDVVAEIELLVNRGYQEAVITGVHLGGYGSDIGTDLCALTEAILARTSIARLRLSSLEPWDLPDDFARLWQNPRLMPHLHLPLQSGSDTVLRRMARRCPTARYRDLVLGLRETIPELCITTDLIVGFPGETTDEWDDTQRFVEEIGFSHVHIFQYSPREGTPAARMKGHVSGPDKKVRSRQMHAIARAMKAAHHHKFAGQTRSVLWEGAGQEVEGGLRFAGYTDNYLRVETLRDPGEASLENRVSQVALELAETPESPLVGRVIV